VEGRERRVTELEEGKMDGAQTPDIVSTKLRQIAKRARERPGMAFTNLSHHIDLDFLREAFRRTRKDGAPGVDGVTAQEYEGDLDRSLQDLLERMKSGTYRAPAVRRVHIPKDGRGKTRPIGIPTLEDKVLQRAATMVLEAVYEQDFLDCSYGFRPGRSAHQGLQALWDGLMRMGGGFVLDVDIQGFFDNLDHTHLRAFLDRRVCDRGLRRLIGKWLNAGVLEAGELHYPDAGTPQGGVISPLLANVYLHEVLDRWFSETVLPLMEGRAFMVRYADDFVMAFTSQRDAERVWRALPKRFNRFGLSLNMEKSRILEFRRPRPGGPEREGSRPETFDFLGFTHHWGRTLKGKWAVKRRTARGRLKRALKRVADWCRDNRHVPLALQHRRLSKGLQGHYAYYGITGNIDALQRFRELVRKAWRKWLNRRSWMARLSWEKMALLLQRFPLPRARVVQSVYPRAANP
jgi:group II intron reverse transcriptase/maturase